MQTKLHPLLLAGVVVSAFTSTLTAAELGDPAAPLAIAEWIKGDAVDLATAKGKQVVVVEFWATWCGPCRTSIPHLTEMQKKFAKRGVVFVGVSDETAAKVRPFVDNMGEKMDYTVALDRDGKTSEGYMRAYGVNGIPHAFIVDKEGRVAWHGHPMAGLDKALDQLAANTYDLGAEKKRGGAQKKLDDYVELAGSGVANEQLEKLGLQLLALDQELGGIEPGEKLDLAALRKSARFESLMRDYQQALSTGRGETELERIEKLATPFAPGDFKFAEFKGQFQVQRLFQDYYRAVTGKGDAARAQELATKLEAIKTPNAEVFNEMAWTLLTDEKIKTRNLKLAMKFAQTAYDGTKGKDAGVLDTYARALFDNGRVAEAIEQQKSAIELCADQQQKAEFQASLKRYQAKSGGK